MDPFFLIVILVGSIIATAFFFLRGGKGGVALDSTKFQNFKLAEKITVSHDTHIFRFALHHEKQTLGLPIGQHIVLRANCKNGDSSEMVQHSYTPISSDDDKGYVDFLVKVYFANVNPRFPKGGRLSQHLYNMKIGDSMEMRGPQGKFEYKGHGRVVLRKGAGPATEVRVDAFAMVAGGTGITPLLQIIRAVKKDPTDQTKLFLVYGNQTEKDILLRKEIDELAASYPDQVQVWYTVDRDVSPEWKFDTGYVNEEMFRKHLPVLENKKVTNHRGISSAMGLMCGPPPMVQYAIKPNLEKIGYTEDMLFSF